MQARSVSLPKRKRLPHEIPGWVPSGARYFVTINCDDRGCNILAHDSVAPALIEGVHIYSKQGRWYPWVVVVMPDHVHMILSVGIEDGLKKSIGAWKGYFTKQKQISWQSGFFDHRLRSDEAYVEKAAYIRMNPVRKNLVLRPEDWPYRWERAGFDG